MFWFRITPVKGRRVVEDHERGRSGEQQRWCGRVEEEWRWRRRSTKKGLLTGIGSQQGSGTAGQNWVAAGLRATKMEKNKGRTATCHESGWNWVAAGLGTKEMEKNEGRTVTGNGSATLI
ncbi:hypothetical protein AMTR_s00070p00121690 [Amborella trichopoda]|uniref:Uncharacterized protein n=1 Tax=Amborella trichopoda TaxID=13333 RepID=U5DJ44_AMBTC|nr:hypothetical protein AMTR_s00070p00121690 [Amborella trichopoda]